MSASEPMSKPACHHEWMHVSVYDSDLDRSKHHLECRLCGVNAGDDVCTKIHGMKYVSLHFPPAGFEMVYKRPSNFHGTGMNTWYPEDSGG